MSEFGAAEFDDGLVLAQPPREHNLGDGTAKENIGFPLVEKKKKKKKNAPPPKKRESQKKKNPIIFKPTTPII